MNCIDGMRKLNDNSVDSIVTDPPYGIEFMGKEWDSFSDNTNSALGKQSPANKNSNNKAFKTRGKPISGWCEKDRQAKYAFQDFCYEWAKECLRVLKPGGYLLAFGGTRTYHRMACAVEDAGFEIRDQMQWIYGCLSEDTEILTSEGWRTKDNIKENDEIFSLDLASNKIIPNKVKHVFQYHHNGKMVSILNDNTDQLLTLNHKVICQEGRRVQVDKERRVVWDKGLKYKDACFIDGEYYKLPLAGYFDGNYSIGKDFSELIGWILSEGHFHKDTNAISIYQSSVNADKVKRIKYILGRCKIKYSHYEREREYKDRLYTEHQFYFSGEIVDEIKDIIPNKKPLNKLWYLPLKEKERLYNGLCLGDGSKGDSTEFQAFYQKDIKFLEWFQVLLHLMGKQGRINKDKYSCSIHHNNSTEVQGKHCLNRIVDYNGRVWCIETEIGNFIAKRNGKIFLTGNSGFPKSHNISKAIDKKAGAERTEVIGKSNSKGIRSGSGNYVGDDYKQKGYDITAPAIDDAKQWDGWGTALKPAHEPIVVARKPLSEKTVAENVLKWGTGGINIDGCRIETTDILNGGAYAKNGSQRKEIWGEDAGNSWRRDRGLEFRQPQGRFPANVILDEEAGRLLDEQSGTSKSKKSMRGVGYTDSNIYGTGDKDFDTERGFNDSGGASRFFYCAKASKKERGDSKHPTVKPLKLMRYLVRLVTPPNGIALDPFAGSGTTLEAAILEGFNVVGIEKEHGYIPDIRRRIERAQLNTQALEMDLFLANYPVIPEG